MSNWIDAKKAEPKKDHPVVAADRHGAYIAKCYGNGDWVKCEMDGDMNFNKDGTSARCDPDWWSEHPNG